MGYFESIYSDENLPHRAKAVYMYLKDRANKDSQCWPGIKTIARELQLSVSTVKRALNDLEQHGYLEKTARLRSNGGTTSNLYTVKQAQFPTKG